MKLGDKIQRLWARQHNPVLRVNVDTMEMRMASDLIRPEDNEMDIDADIIPNWFDSSEENQEITEADWSNFSDQVREITEQ